MPCLPEGCLRARPFHLKQSQLRIEFGDGLQIIVMKIQEKMKNERKNETNMKVEGVLVSCHHFTQHERRPLK